VPDPLTDTVQELGVNEPPEPPSLHATVPEGKVGEALMSDSVAVNVIELPALTEDGLGETAVIVE
jgi:hypothetical protein